MRGRPTTSTACGAPGTSATRPGARHRHRLSRAGTAQRRLTVPYDFERASSTSRAPAGVVRTPECERSNSVMPNSASKPDTCLTSAGVDTRNCAAAREKLPSFGSDDMASSLLSYT